jgi:hypothetical protein
MVVTDRIQLVINVVFNAKSIRWNHK